MSVISQISDHIWRPQDLRQSTVVVVARRRGVGSSVTFTSRLDPHDGINETGASVGGRLSAKSRAEDVAPITPPLADVLDTRATLVNNKVSREA